MQHGHWNRWMKSITGRLQRWLKKRSLSAVSLPGLACICVVFLVAVLVLVIPDSSDAAGVFGNAGSGPDDKLKIIEATRATDEQEYADSEQTGGNREETGLNSEQTEKNGGQVMESGDDTVDKWNLILVNPWNPVPEQYEVTLETVENGHRVDERCYGDLVDMLEDCREEGLSPYICSSYRDMDYQQGLFDGNVRQLLARGYTQEEAEQETATCIAIPGTSEHQLGLAVDIVDKNYQTLDETQEDTEVQKWLMENCWRYGFILRYPTDKSDVTGIIYEPWHYRYVGKTAAKEIYDQGVCLEEYLRDLKSK